MSDAAYYIRLRGRILGPFNVRQLRDQQDRGYFSAFHEVSTDRRTWVPAATLTELFPAEAPVALPPENRPQPETTVPHPRSPWYYLSPSGDRIGPLTDEALRAMAHAGQLTAKTFVSREGQAQWVTLADAGLVGDARPGTARRPKVPWAWLGGGVAVLALLAAAVWAALALRPGGSMTIDTSQPDQVSATVGMVVWGWDEKYPDGKKDQEWGMTGSCFAISPDGHILTNKHVVIPLLKPSTKEEKKSGKISLGDHDLWLKENHVDSQQTIWVFFGGVKHKADVLHIFESFDVAILKIERRDTPYFSLATSSDLARTRSVEALGFPATSRVRMSEEDEMKSYVKQQQYHNSVGEYFERQDFVYVSKVGGISRTYADSGIQVIEHDAAINPGSSGGPLALKGTDVVVGINTAGSKSGQGTFFAIAVTQLKAEIDQFVPRPYPRWRKP
jgi:S1-C subfamily serine protease